MAKALAKAKSKAARSDQNDPARSDGKRRETTLAQMKYPLVYFALALCIAESTFGFMLVRHSYSTAVTITIVISMAVVFALSIGVVALLTYKVPTHIMLQPQASVVTVDPEVSLQMKRVREATRVLLQYSSNTLKNPTTLLDALESVEAILSGRKLQALEKEVEEASQNQEDDAATVVKPDNPGVHPDTQAREVKE